MAGGDTFMKITNKDIFNKIEESIKVNQKEHNLIIKHQMETNGKVKLNRWIATSAFSLFIVVVGLWTRHIITS